MNDIIKYWDENVVERHIGTEINWLFLHLDKHGIDELSYIDIGSNVGKFYDEISKKYKIKSCIMVEPSKFLFEHMVEKYLGIESIEIHNFAISDDNGNYELDNSVISSINYFNTIGVNDSINLGLSKLNKRVAGDTVCYSMEYFLEKINKIPLHDIDFIKIDTENMDLQIIKSMTKTFIENKINPFILFENNFHNDMSFEDAQKIIDDFCSKCGYESVDLSVPGDSFITPIKK